MIDDVGGRSKLIDEMVFYSVKLSTFHSDVYPILPIVRPDYIGINVSDAEFLYMIS